MSKKRYVIRWYSNRTGKRGRGKRLTKYVAVFWAKYANARWTDLDHEVYYTPFFGRASKVWPE